MEENRNFAEKFNFEFPLLCDVDRAMGLAYGATNDPKTSYANRIGVVIDSHGKIKEYHPSVDAKTYAQDLLSRL